MNTGDREPPWTVDITDASGQANFPTVESWRFDAYRETTDGKVPEFTDATPTITPGAVVSQVSVAHAWATGQTDVEGILHGVPVAVWPGGKEQSFPGASIEISTP